MLVLLVDVFQHIERVGPIVLARHRTREHVVHKSAGKRPFKVHAFFHVFYENRIEIVQGTLDMLILKTLQWGEQHGYGISQAIRASSGEVLQVETGSLYPALHRLERQKWVKLDRS